MRETKRVSRWVVTGICVAAFAARLGAFLILDRPHHPETWESETIALHLLEGKGFVFRFLETDYHSYMEPLYPGLCALVYAVAGHHPLALGFVHIVLGTALVWLVYACARRVTPTQHAALMAAAVAALHPALILYTTKFHPFILDSLLLLAVLAGCLWFSSGRPWLSIARLGILLGLCILSRPTVLATVPLIGWWIWRSSSGHWRRRALTLALVAVCAAGVVAPWVWRNYRTHKRFILTRSGTSMVFWFGNNPHHFTGSLLTPSGEAILDLIPETMQRRLLSLDELGQQDLFWDEASRFVRAHPLEFLRRWGLKLWYFWWFSPQAGLWYPHAWRAIYQVVYLGLIGLAAVGLWSGWRAPVLTAVQCGRVLLIVAFCFLISGVQSLYYVEGRHRLAIEPLLLILTGQGLEWFVSRVSMKVLAPMPARSAGSRA